MYKNNDEKITHDTIVQMMYFCVNEMIRTNNRVETNNYILTQRVNSVNEKANALEKYMNELSTKVNILANKILPCYFPSASMQDVYNLMKTYLMQGIFAINIGSLVYCINNELTEYIEDGTLEFNGDAPAEITNNTDLNILNKIVNKDIKKLVFPRNGNNERSWIVNATNFASMFDYDDAGNDSSIESLDISGWKIDTDMEILNCNNMFAGAEKITEVIGTARDTLKLLRRSDLTIMIRLTPSLVESTKRTRFKIKKVLWSGGID